MYKELRNSGIIWTDARGANAGRLINPNTKTLNGEYFDVSPNAVGFDKKSENTELQICDIVILDTDYIYREDAEKIWWPGGNSYSEYFEKQWQQEKQQEIANNYNNKGEMESEKSKRKDEEHSK